MPRFVTEKKLLHFIKSCTHSVLYTHLFLYLIYIAICRVCRCEGSVEQPLFHPCKCSGSIRYVHQDWYVKKTFQGKHKATLQLTN